MPATIVDYREKAALLPINKVVQFLNNLGHSATERSLRRAIDRDHLKVVKQNNGAPRVEMKTLLKDLNAKKTWVRDVPRDYKPKKGYLTIAAAVSRYNCSYEEVLELVMTGEAYAMEDVQFNTLVLQVKQEELESHLVKSIGPEVCNPVISPIKPIELPVDEQLQVLPTNMSAQEAANYLCDFGHDLTVGRIYSRIKMGDIKAISDQRYVRISVEELDRILTEEPEWLLKVITLKCIPQGYMSITDMGRFCEADRHRIYYCIQYGVIVAECISDAKSSKGRVFAVKDEEVMRVMNSPHTMSFLRCEITLGEFLRLMEIGRMQTEKDNGEAASSSETGGTGKGNGKTGNDSTPSPDQEPMPPKTPDPAPTPPSNDEIPILADGGEAQDSADSYFAAIGKAYLTIVTTESAIQAGDNPKEALQKAGLL